MLVGGQQAVTQRGPQGSDDLFHIGRREVKGGLPHLKGTPAQITAQHRDQYHAGTLAPGSAAQPVGLLRRKITVTHAAQQGQGGQLGGTVFRSGLYHECLIKDLINPADFLYYLSVLLHIESITNFHTFYHYQQK